MKRDAAYWIRSLDLQPHPEGGYYRQTYRAELLLGRPSLPAGFAGPRAALTAIYFLLEEGNFSAFHRIPSDELWHFYFGSPVMVHVISPDGGYFVIHLGNAPEAGQVFQAVVKAGCWFASHVTPQTHENGEKPLALVGCTVAPGFDFQDFELAKREELLRRYPQHREIITKLTRT